MGNNSEKRNPFNNNLDNINPGIYIHIPFCVKKCNYCAFLSAASNEETRLEYVDALIKEIDLYVDEKVDEKAGEKADEKYEGVFDSIYFGGGTPSLLPPEQIERIISELKKVFNITSSAEITLEANPGTLGKDNKEISQNLSGYINAGVNRLSFGVQSMDNASLKKLGRIHSSEDVVRDYEIARSVGFKNISLDLILSIPIINEEASLGISIDDVNKIIDLAPEHISCYSLQLEEGTPFYEMAERGILKEVSDIEDRKTYHQVCDILHKAGYEQYEISNFARISDGEEGKYRSRHNSKYWDMADYVGLGLGASGFLKGTRYKNTSSMKEYMSKVDSGKKPIEEIHQNTDHDNISEAVFTGLRKTEGIEYKDIARFVESRENSEPAIAFWQYYSGIREELEEFERNGYVEITDVGIRLTEYGIDISNKIMSLFV